MKHLGLSAALALTLSATSLHALSDEEGEEEVEGAGTEKVVLCHKGRKSISVGAPGLAAHLAHGDTEGACEGAVEPGNGGENGGYDGSAAVVLMRCGVPEVSEGSDPAFEVTAFSSSVDLPESPLGEDCADALAGFINNNFSLVAVTGATDYTLVGPAPAP
jgi:hypothetical protein